MAILFAANNFGWAVEFYRQFPRMPVSRIRFAELKGTHRFSTAKELFQQIQKHCAHRGEIVVASHSFERGLHVRLDSRSPAYLGLGGEKGGLDALLAALKSDDETSRSKLRKAGRWDEKGAQGFLALVGMVRSLELKAVHFRGCNLGASPSSLRGFRELLGCDGVTALDVSSLYAPVSVTTQSRSRGARDCLDPNTHLLGRSSRLVKVWGKTPERFALEMPPAFTSTTERCLKAWTESSRATAEFQSRNLGSVGRRGTFRRFWIHGAEFAGELTLPFENRAINHRYASHIKDSSR